MANPIRFTFDRDKFKTVMQILGRETSGLDVLKAVKLLYFIDRLHLRTYGRPVLGDFYVAMKLGPVPSHAYDELKRIQVDEAPDLPLSSVDEGGKHRVFRASVAPDLSLLSATELSAVRSIIDDLGHLTGTELSRRAHTHDTWLTNKPEENEPPKRIDYERFFKEDHESCKHAFEAMLLEQEERDFARGV